MRAVLGLAAVVALLGLMPLPASAEPPEVDVKAAIAALAKDPIYFAPGSVARLDVDEVRKKLPPDTKVFIGPYRPKGETDKQFTDRVYQPLWQWARQHHFELIMVTGLYAEVVWVTADGPHSLSDLREQTAYQDVTAPVLSLSTFLAGNHVEVPYPTYSQVDATPAELDAVTGKLRGNPVYNAPGRADPVRFTPDLPAEFGHDVRILALPVLTSGEPLVDYASALVERFPDSVVVVAQGSWVEVEGPDQDALTAARDFTFGHDQGSALREDTTMSERITTIADRVGGLRRTGNPLAPPPSQPGPFDVHRAISDAAPWALLGSAVVLTWAGLTFRRLRTAQRDADEKKAMALARAETFARVGELGARFLAAEEAGGVVDPAAAERYETARSLYDQARTAAAMREVAKVADEGLRLLAEGASR